MKSTLLYVAGATLMMLSGVARANIVDDYEGLTEGSLGTSFSTDHFSYRDANQVSGINLDGEAFGPGDLGSLFLIEDATDFYDAFPTYGSPINSLTFGSAYVPGPNLSIGVLSSIYVDLDQSANSASLDLAFYENGPWGGVEYHLDALNAGVVVGSSTYTIANGGGRDNATFTTMSVTAGAFDSLHLYGMIDGHYTNPRGMIDDLSFTPVPEPATLAVLGLSLVGLLRRRRK